MTLRQFEYLLAVLDEGSFTRAAERLSVAQPSLSQQIQALEREIGGPLLERLRSEVRLTPAGEAFVPEARLAVRAADRARRAARAVLAGEVGELEIATVLSIAAGLLPYTMPAWHERFPRVVTRLHEYKHRNLLEHAVADGVGDLAIGPRPKHWSGAAASLGFEEFVIVLPVGDPLVDGSGAVDLKELFDRGWVLFAPDHGLSEVVKAACHWAGFEPRGVAQTHQVDAAARLAASGLGPALVPDNALPPGLEAAILHLRHPVYRELFAYTRTAFSPLARAYITVLRETPLSLRQLPSVAEQAPTEGVHLLGDTGAILVEDEVVPEILGGGRGGGRFRLHPR